MKIGIDISQIAHEGTGVAKYTRRLVGELLRVDKKNEYVLFYSSLRKQLKDSQIKKLKDLGAEVKEFRIPPIILEFLWNRLHVLPIEWLIGPVDVFFSSDWLQPPARAKKVTTLHDLIVYKYPESFGKKGGHDIVANQKRRLRWVAQECDRIICDSETTKQDAREILGISEKRLTVVYPGGS